MRPAGVSVVAAMLPGKAFGFLAMAIGTDQGTTSSVTQSLINQSSTSTPISRTRWQVTASPQAVSGTDQLDLDFQTTAESLLFMTPYLLQPDPDGAQIILATIAADPNTGVLANDLALVWNEPDPLNDPLIQSDIQDAVNSITTTLSAQAQAAPTAKSRTAQPRTATSNSSTPLQVEATPYCWDASKGVYYTPYPAGSLQCQDLDFIKLDASGANATGEVAVSDQNCPDNQGTIRTFYLHLGCAVDWVVEEAPTQTTNLASIGQTTGPESPSGAFLPDCLGQNASSCTILSLPGSGIFSWLDVVGDLQQILSNALSVTSASVGFPISTASPGNYAARAYSGGIANPDESAKYGTACTSQKVPPYGWQR